MPDIYYVNSQNKKINLNSDGVICTAKDVFRGYKWSYNKLYDRIASFSNEITEYQIDLATYGSDARDKEQEIYEAIETDVLANTAGYLYFGDWYIKGFFYASEKTDTRYKSNVQMTLTFVTDAPRWTKVSLHRYRYNSSEAGGEGYDFPYDFPYDYISNNAAKVIYNTTGSACDMIIVIYGSSSTCNIVIGGHAYSVNQALLTGEYLTINTKEKTIVKTDRIGGKTNCFSKRNKDSYVFQKLATGTNQIISQYATNFDITILQERSEPTWT